MDCFSAEMKMSWVKVELISCLYRRWQCFKNILRLMTSPVRSRRYWEWVKRIEFRWKWWIIFRFALKRHVELIVLEEVKQQVSSYLLRRRACSLCVMLLCGRSCCISRRRWNSSGWCLWSILSHRSETLTHLCSPPLAPIERWWINVQNECYRRWYKDQ